MKKKALREKIMKEVVRLRSVPKSEVRIPIQFGEIVVINRNELK